MAVFAPDDFGISPTWQDDEVHVTHFEIDDDLRRQHIGSAVLETLKRVYYYEGAERLVVRMGGGDAAAAFLRANDFEVQRRTEIEEVAGGAIVTGAYEYDPVDA